MKKIILFLSVAFMTVIMFSSCNKKDDVDMTKYASTVSGEFFAQEGDILLKSADLTVGGHWFDGYDKKYGQTSWTRIDGTEFLPGSDPAIDWTNFAPVWFAKDQAVRYTYCPVLPLRVVLKTSKDNSSTYSYLGISDIPAPDHANFPITVNCRRLGDKLTLNTNALTSLPGAYNLKFYVSYTKSIIDIPNTILNSPNDTKTEWPTYSYLPTTESVSNQEITGSGDVDVYDGFDAKLTGVITIKVVIKSSAGHPDAIFTNIVNASSLGNGMKITLTTTRSGWFDSDNLNITDNPIGVEEVVIPIN